MQNENRDTRILDLITNIRMLETEESIQNIENAVNSCLVVQELKKATEIKKSN